MIKFARKERSKGRLWLSLDEEERIGWLALPGDYGPGLDRHRHFAVALGWLADGIAYLVFLFTSGDWWRLVPTSWSILPATWHSLTLSLTGHLAPTLPGSPSPSSPTGR